LRWQPTRAEILIPGDLGFTTGRYERRAKNKEGKVEVEHGTYVSVWRKQADGSWKIILDTGNADPAEAK
jgi:ketosteroid isomerase-like protein